MTGVSPMTRIYRGMLPGADGKPLVGQDGKMLGVRLSIDITPDAAGRVHPRTGGMSVAPALVHLPHHRIPKRLRQAGLRHADGSDKLSVWAMGIGAFVEGPLWPELFLRVDPRDPRHGFVEPHAMSQTTRPP